MAIVPVTITPTGFDSVGADLYYALPPAQGAQAVYVQVPLITKLTPPQIQIKALKATAINQGDRVERYIPGMTEGGQVQFSCVYQATVYQALVNIQGQTINWRIVFPDTTYVEFPGFLEKFYVGQLSASENEAVSLEGEIKVAANSAYFWEDDD